MRRPYLLVALLATFGATAAAAAYFGGLGWETGVERTPGALLALTGACCVALGACVATIPGVRGRAPSGLSALLGLAAALTALAAWFLMQPAFAVLMALALVATIYADARSDRRAVAP